MTESITYEQFKQRLVDEYNSSQGELTGYCCALCKNKGYVQRLENGEIINRECACVTARQTMRKLEKSGLSGLLKEYTFASFEVTSEWQKAAKQKAINFVKSAGEWFFIGGQSGAGKTHLCTAMCGQFLKQNKSVRYMIWTMEIRNFKANANDEYAYQKLFNDFAKTDILYIDDLFKIKKKSELTPADIQHTYDIINYRYNNQLCTIISSEMSIGEILEMDTATGSRIYQRAKGYTIELGEAENKNWRLR